MHGLCTTAFAIRPGSKLVLLCSVAGQDPGLSSGTSDAHGSRGQADDFVQCRASAEHVLRTEYRMQSCSAAVFCALSAKLRICAFGSKCRATTQRSRQQFAMARVAPYVYTLRHVSRKKRNRASTSLCCRSTATIQLRAGARDSSWHVSPVQLSIALGPPPSASPCL